MNPIERRAAFSPAIPPEILDGMLEGYNQELRHYLVSGFRQGFSTGCTNLSPGDAATNLPSCQEAPHVIDQYIEKEMRAGRLAGPFLSTNEQIRKISPIGLISKSTPGDYRVIHHLSFPAGESVNDSISRAHTAVQYGSIDDAVELVGRLENPYMAKTDIVKAFRIIPIIPSETSLLAFRWRDRIYTDLALPMGCASSSQIFQAFSDALVWIARKKFGASHIISVLDDFLFVGETSQECWTSLNGFQAMCEALNVPLHPSKTVEPCQSLKFLGVELDVASKVMRIPAEKIERMRNAVSGLITRKKAPLRQVQACIGLLNFACVAVPLGRPFLRRLSDMCCGIRRPYHRVSLTKAARLDLRAWLLFLDHFNGRSLLDGRRWQQSPGLVLETDAAGAVGIGAVCGRRWLHGSWPDWLGDADISLKELVAVVVPLHVWSNDLANQCVLIRSDNSGVVSAINSQSSQSPCVMQWLRHLFIIVVRHNILVRALHIPGAKNSAPDALSRGRIQVFRNLRPEANFSPSDWTWDDLAMLKPRPHMCRRH